MSEPLLVVEGVWKKLCRSPDYFLRYAFYDVGREIIGRQPRKILRPREFWALQDISFSVSPGEVLGVIGHNGAGKSTLLNLITGMILPTSGSIHVLTKRLAFIDAGGGLNTRETGRENTFTQLALHGFSNLEIQSELPEVEAFADIGDFIDAPVSTYSLGMKLRLAFAIYTRLKPDIFVIDEAIGGGDIRFRNRFSAYLKSYIEEGGAVLLCTHELLIAQMLCTSCILLDHGRVITRGDTVETISKYHELTEQTQSGKQSQTDENNSSASKAPSIAPPLDPRLILQAVRISTPNDSLLNPGGTVHIEVDLHATERIEGVACAIEIGQGDVVAMATIVGGYPDHAFTIQPPMTTVRCCIDQLPLAPGRYEVRIGISIPHLSQTLALSGYLDSPAVLQVISNEVEVNNVMSGRGNIVYVPASWQSYTSDPV